MRIASLVPSATEYLYALGLGDQVVAVTHECDYPPEAANHHPDLAISWKDVTVSLSTHSEGGITGADVALASEIDAVAAQSLD